MVRRTTAAACLLSACAMFALLSASALATPGSLEFGKCAKTAGGKNGPRIPGAKRFERPQFLRQLKRHLSRLHLGINVQSRNQVLFSQARRRMFVQAPAKLGYLAAPNR